MCYSIARLCSHHHTRRITKICRVRREALLRVLTTFFEPLLLSPLRLKPFVSNDPKPFKPFVSKPFNPPSRSSPTTESTETIAVRLQRPSHLTNDPLNFLQLLHITASTSCRSRPSPCCRSRPFSACCPCRCCCSGCLLTSELGRRGSAIETDIAPFRRLENYHSRGN